MGRVVERYLFGQAAAASLLSLGVLTGVLLALFFAELLGDAAGGEVAGGLVLELLLLRLPEALVLVGPLALLTGLLLALGRLGQDHELTILRASGLAAGRLMLAVMALAVVWAAGLVLISGWASPWAAGRSATLLERSAEESLLAGIRAGRFQRFEAEGINLYVGARGEGEYALEQVFIHHHGADGPEMIAAPRGRIWIEPESGVRFLSLFDGYQVRHGEGGEFFPLEQLEFARNDLRLPVPRVIERHGTLDRLDLVEVYRAEGPGAHREWHWRLAPALASLLLAALAAPIALGNPRSGRFASVVVALVIYLAYSNAVNLGLLRIERQGLADGPGLWPLHGLVLGIAIVFWLGLRRRW